ncbi:MAG TPA: hypothetical protein VMU04_05220 [Candidatus Acidoferrum sp.]|nr:hypothetical protein [Candidatus Acidoferrum sp.]
MSVKASKASARAMTLVELLCVIGIIALLAAMLLPAAGQAKARARRMQCVNQLHETGVGFTSFANDHGGLFPMAVPASAGGTLEVARGGEYLGADFYFSYRHFQAVSNELVVPRLVTCPTDTRVPAPSFAELSNSNLSYFIGINADFARPSSILAGDRNLTNELAGATASLQLGPNEALHWTEALHRFKGNLLYSDAHVEGKNDAGLMALSGQSPGAAALALPNLPPPGRSQSGLGSESSATQPWAKPSRRAAPTVLFCTTPAGRPIWIVTIGSNTEQWSVAPRSEAPHTNSVPEPKSSSAEEHTETASASWAGTVTTMTTGASLAWYYAFLLLVLAAVLVLRKSARSRRQAGRARPSEPTRPTQW